MIDWLQAVLLAILQGLTEFLPISSSAHLVIPSLALGWPDQGLAFDVAVHVGTLVAVVFYYRRDLLSIARGGWRVFAGDKATPDSRMLWYLLVASVPVGLVGILQAGYIEANARTLPVIATTTLVFGLLLGVADRYAQRRPGSRRLDLSVAVLIGLAQALAPIPGVSRSGITITAALLLNLSRHDAARFSFLLSIPVISGAGVLKALELLQANVFVDWPVMGVAAVVSGLTAYCCIAVFIRLLDRVGMMPFVYYRIVLAALLYVIWLS